jgi:predicted phage-related endonuclease
MNEMLILVNEINEYTELLEEVKEILADRQDKIKAYMTAANLEELNVDNQFFVRYQPIARNTLNTTLLKKDLPDLYKSYLKVVNSTRFTISPA